MATYPFYYEDLDEETNEAIKRDFTGNTKGMMRVKPFNLCVPPEFKIYGEKIYNMEVRPDDVWVVTYPKTGTTWTQAAIWSILNDGKLELLKENPQLNTWRFIETDAISKDGMDHVIAQKLIADEHLPMIGSFLNQFEKAVDDVREKPRLIKSHLPFPFLPPNLLDTAKVVYIARNPKDTCVSFYYHQHNIKSHGFEGTFEEFFEYFLQDLVLESPYWSHVIDAWNRRQHPNMLFMFYEDMKKDFPGALRKLATFLGKPISEDLIEKLNVELSVEGMKRNPALNVNIIKDIGLMKKEGSFVRKGIVGDWKNHFTPEMEKRMDEWSKKEREGSDIKFPGED